MGVLRKLTLQKSPSSSNGRKIAKKQPKTTIGSLPKDLLVDILAWVGSSSFTDVFSAKQCCKDFLEATEENYVIQSISLDKFPTIHWFPPSDGVRSFLMNCFDKGNPESLFRQGMIKYFNLGEVESGLEYLKRASEKEHTEATYVYGMILLSQGDRWSEQGLKLLNSMKNSLTRYWDVDDCRNKIKRVLNAMWINNTISVQEISMECQKGDHGVHRIRRLEDEEINSCYFCMWYREFFLFCRMLNIDI
ncbi:hypothetical protein L2E82_28449 [Cichorium intybus]|uniref:Uncharacterized protein n=1 Tax=Cichorium intybus TaxID=13427 RepID=A0ACB9CW63_CICIN|nr:hypothetical protein L2E82_28449 [Cichorium intybus]